MIIFYQIFTMRVILMTAALWVYI